jgi:hypothetical protein
MPTLIAERLSAQLLSGERAEDPLAAARHLLAIQGQDARGARLAVRARTRGVRAADVDGALTERSLVITWVNRGTLHLLASEDYHWLHALTTPPLHTANARRLQQEGVSEAAAERGVKAITRALASEGPLSREQLRERVEAVDVPTKGVAFLHLLMRSSLRGLTVRGPMVDGHHRYALVRDWLPRAPHFDRDRSLAELARRYLVAHAPANDRDLARWAGLPLRDARAGLAAIASELRERPDGLLEPVGRGAPARMPPPQLLGAFDPVLLGWCSRDAIVGEHKLLVTDNGVFRPFALVGGRAVATWGLVRGEVELRPLEPLSPATRRALEREARDVVRFLGE